MLSMTTGGTTWVPLMVLGVLFLTTTTLSQDTDQFTYRSEGSTSPNNQYPPEEWMNVRCSDLDTCAGWPDAFKPAVDWRLRNNDCRWCPASGSRCGTHHQSPINLERNRAVNESRWHNQCIDVHLMKFFDSSCSWDELVRLNAFSIERHALKIRQPIEEFGGRWRNACRNDQSSYRFGRIDFSRGFSHWWLLSHTDIHVPSEHTQEGKRYDAEMQLYHFYSVSAEEAGVANQMATVSIFMQAYDDAPDYDMLNRVICQWRRVEDETREQCGLPSVESYYPGCFYFRRGHDENRNLRRVSPDAATKKARTAQEVMEEKMTQAAEDPEADDWKMEVQDEYDNTDIDWGEFIREAYKHEEDRRHGRHLLDYSHVGPWHNYWGLLGVKTEYYYRYSGTQTVPPCFGRFTSGTRANTNHWRVMKDPIRVSERQIDELHRLLKDRIAPADDPIRACQPDTAAAPYEGNPNRVNVSRPLMSTENAHFKVFCECRWGSEWIEDQMWCQIRDQMERLYEHPYNFPSDGF